MRKFKYSYIETHMKYLFFVYWNFSNEIHWNREMRNDFSYSDTSTELWVIRTYPILSQDLSLFLSEPLEGDSWWCSQVEDLWMRRRFPFHLADQGWCYLRREILLHSNTRRWLTMIVNLDGNEVSTRVSAGLVSDADPTLVQLETGYLADVDVVGPVGEDGVESDAQPCPQRHQDRQDRGQHSWMIPDESLCLRV